MEASALMDALAVDKRGRPVRPNERQRAVAEAALLGATVPDAMRAAGYSERYVHGHAGPYHRNLIALGLLPNPELQRAAVLAHDEAIEAFMVRLRDALPEAADRLIAWMRESGEALPALEDGERRGGRDGLREFLDRVVGKPAVHIHGHKDAVEAEDREIVVRVIRGGA